METLTFIMYVTNGLAIGLLPTLAYFTYRNFKKSASIQKQIKALDEQAKQVPVKHPDRPSFKPITNKMNSNDIYNG